MMPFYVYLRYDEEKGKHYISHVEDEETGKTSKNARMYEREYGEKEELTKKWHCKQVKNSTIVYEVRDQTDAKFREKWIPFKKDRIVGWQKGGRVLTQEMMELLGADGKKDLSKLSNVLKDKYYELIARKVMRMRELGEA